MRKKEQRLVEMDKTNWLDEQCATCEKIFKKPIQVLLHTAHPDLMIASTQFCSEQCEKLFNDSWENLQNVCRDCGRLMEKYDGSNGYSVDVKEKKRYPYCDSCTEEKAKTIREGLNGEKDA